jgi:hypothetical protein
MENEEDHAHLKRQLAEVAHVLNPAERELWSAMQRFVDEHAMAGGSRNRALAIIRTLLRKASDMKARQRRASFKVISWRRGLSDARIIRRAS